MNTTDLTKYKIAFRLYENARAFVESSVAHVKENSREDWTFAILHLTIAIELLLKARLSLEDHLHLPKRPFTPVSNAQFLDGTFFSVTWHECVDRLKKVCAFPLSDKQRDTLNELMQLRNRTVHYVAPTFSELEDAVGRGLNLFVDINAAAGFTDDEAFGARPIAKLITDLSTAKSFVLQRMESLSDQLLRAERPRTRHADECPHCLQDAAIIDDGDIICLYCGLRRAIECVAQWISDDGLDETCPECDRFGVARHDWKEGPTWECFCCGYFRGTELKACTVVSMSPFKTEEIPRLHPESRSPTKGYVSPW